MTPTQRNKTCLSVVGCFVSKIAAIATCIGFTTLGGYSSTALSADPITLDLLTWRPVDQKVWDAINQQQLLPGIKVNARPVVRAYYFDVVKLKIQNKEADLFLWQPGASRLKELIDKGFIEPYEKDLSMMNVGALAGAIGPDGQYYGVPFAVQLQALLVNMKEARKAGVTHKPSTIAELETAFDKFKQAGKTPIYFAVNEGWYISQLMGEVLTAGLVEEKVTQELIDGTRCFTDSSYTLIFETLQRWQKMGYINPNVTTATYYDMFTAVSFGNAVSSIEGGWMTSRAEPYYTMDPSYEFGFWTIPGTAGKYSAFGDGTFQVAANSPNKAAAQQVLDFTTTKKFAELFAKHIQQLPAYGGKINIAAGDLRTMSELVAKNSYSVSLFNSHALNRTEPSYKTLFREAVQALLAKKLSPQQASKHIQEGLNEWEYAGASQCSL